MSIASNRNHTRAIERVLRPIQQVFDTGYFTYCRYSNGGCEMISSNPNTPAEFLNNPKNRMPVEATNTTAIVDWRRYCSESYLELIKERYNISTNGVTFVLRHNETEAEHFSLNINSGETKLINTFRSQPKLTHNIITHIRNHINFNKKDFISCFFRKKIFCGVNSPDLKDKGLLDLQHTREYIYGLNGPTYITRTEKKCLLLLLEMKTSNEIAREINTTTRTVEAHMSNLRRKLGTKKRHELFLIARKNFLSSLY